MTAIELVSPAAPDAGDLLRSYFEELDQRFPAGHVPLESPEERNCRLAPPTGIFLVARVSGAPQGCGALTRLDATTAEIRHLYVIPSSRRSGLGQQLLAALEDHALQQGYERVVLDTNAVLREALTLYRKTGYTETNPYNSIPYAHHWFEKRLCSQPTDQRAIPT